MKDAMRLVTTALLLSFGLIGIASAGDIEKRSLPLSGSGYSCNVINVSDTAISGLSIWIITSGSGPGSSSGISIVSFEPDQVKGLQVGGQYSNAAYCVVSYAGRPGDIVATFCALDAVGNCTVAIPID
jgi:hypothetical protein